MILLKLTLCKLIKLIAELCMYVIFVEVLHERKENKQTSILVAFPNKILSFAYSSNGKSQLPAVVKSDSSLRPRISYQRNIIFDVNQEAPDHRRLRNFASLQSNSMLKATRCKLYFKILILHQFNFSFSVGYCLYFNIGVSLKYEYTMNHTWFYILLNTNVLMSRIIEKYQYFKCQ